MSQTTAGPRLRRWVDRLSPEQAERVINVVAAVDGLPEIEAAGETDDDYIEPVLFRSLIGSYDGPGDLRTNPRYLQERAARHGLPTR
jgi:hypothetical protein